MLRENLDQIVRFYLGPPAPILMFVVLFVIAPAMLLALFLLLLVQGRWGASRDGLAMGLAVSFWTSACWLLEGYLGAWLNLPAGLIVVAVFGWLEGTEPSWLLELLVVVMNFLLWPIAGWLFFHAFAKVTRPGPDAAREP